jgi:hypothetical protein
MSLFFALRNVKRMLYVDYIIIFGYRVMFFLAILLI